MLWKKNALKLRNAEGMPQIEIRSEQVVNLQNESEKIEKCY